MIRFITIQQILALIIVNSVGLLLVATIFWVNRLQTRQALEKLALAFGLALIATGIMLVILLDVGISLWISSGNIQSVAITVPMAVCGLPFVFIVSFIGSYIQLGYRDKMQDALHSIARREVDKRSKPKS
jgi:uncharacterized membrane protein